MNHRLTTMHFLGQTHLTFCCKISEKKCKIILCISLSGLPKPPDVLKAATGSNGILAGLKNGAVWIDHSTTDYEQNLMFEEEASKKGAHILESPITGGLEALKKGQMAVWVAGDVEAYKKSKSVLDASYTTVMYTGKLGTAMIPKVLSNMLCAVQVLAMSECFAIGDLLTILLATFAS